MFDVGDRDFPVPTPGNWVIKGCMTKWLRLLRFITFFENPKKHDFLRFFEMLHTFSRTLDTNEMTYRRHSATIGASRQQTQQWLKSVEDTGCRRSSHDNSLTFTQHFQHVTSMQLG